MNNVDNMGIAGPAVNPFSYPSEICSECGSEVFVPGVIMKKVPGVLLGEGGVDFISVPIKVAVCAKCGKQTQVPFNPTQGRDVLCKECFDAEKAASTEA